MSKHGEKVDHIDRDPSNNKLSRYRHASGSVTAGCRWSAGTRHVTGKLTLAKHDIAHGRAVQRLFEELVSRMLPF